MASNSKVIVIVLAAAGALVLGILVACAGGFYYLRQHAEQFAGLLSVDGQSAGLEPRDEDYAEARKRFKTQLVRKGPAPQQWAPVAVPPGVIAVQFMSGRLPLHAWLSAPGKEQGKGPAVLFLHGGFAFDAGDWSAAQPYRDAGFLVMTPILRGENGQPGFYTMFYEEVDDVLAAADYLAKQPHVDPARLYIAGHSVGGTLTLLTAMSSNRFRAAAAFSGSPDQIAFAQAQPALLPFKPTDIREYQMRSPVAFASSFKCPVRLYYGDQEQMFQASSQRTASLAREHGLDVQAISVPGDHFSAAPEAMRQSIRFFVSK